MRNWISSIEPLGGTILVSFVNPLAKWLLRKRLYFKRCQMTALWIYLRKKTTVEGFQVLRRVFYHVQVVALLHPFRLAEPEKPAGEQLASSSAAMQGRPGDLPGDLCRRNRGPGLSTLPSFLYCLMSPSFSTFWIQKLHRALGLGHTPAISALGTRK